jgi:RimJ/RimL family protein N-acetyltransferase
VLKAFTSLFEEFSLNLRRALPSDVDTYYNWANDAVVRQHSINSHPIEYQSHVSWFSHKINTEESFLYLAEKNNVPVGQVRFDLDADSDSFTIGYSIDATFRGQGIGQMVLKLAMEQLSAEDTKKRDLTAVVMEGNIASEKVFERLNFQRLGTKRLEGTNYLVFQKKTTS